jgi:hypothetical protein
MTAYGDLPRRKRHRCRFLRRHQRLFLQHLAEETPGGIEVALCGEQEVDRISVLVDGTV